MSRIFFAGHDRGVRQLPHRVSYDLHEGLTPRPLLYALTGRGFLTIHPCEFMEHGCVPSSWQNQIAAPADCTHSLIGSRRNRRVAATPFHSAATINADANYPSLSEAANKSCTDGRLLKCWSGTVAISVMENSRFLVAAIPIFDNSHNNIPPTNPRRSARWVHILPSGAGTAVTSPTSMPGGTELRLFLSLDLSGSRPTNRQVQLSRRITIRRSEFYIIGFLRGVFRRIPLRPFSSDPPTTYLNRPGARVKATGFRGAVS